MRDKLFAGLQKVYGILMTCSFFAGLIPVIPFVIAIMIGGTTGEAIALFLYKQYYPWVIAVASVAVLVGLLATYVDKSKKNDKK